MSKKFYGCATAVLILLPLMGDSAEQLNVKLGLWEITTETQMSGVPTLPKSVLDKMTPEQQTAMQAVLQAQAGKGPLRDTTQECLTQKDLEEPFNTDDLEGCKRTITTNSRTQKEFRLVCTGERKGSGFFKVNTPTPETMTGDLELTVGENASPVVIKSKMKGKWLSADCGDEADDRE